MSNYPRIFAVTPRVRINAVTPRLKDFPVTIPAGGNPIPHGRCFNFNGTNQYVNIGALSTNIIADGKFSISGWVDIGDTFPFSGGDQTWIAYEIDGNNRFYIKKDDGTNNLRLFAQINGGFNFHDVSILGHSGIINVIWTFNGTSWKAYIENGAANSIVRGDFSATVGIPSFAFGRFAGGGLFASKLFDSRLYDGVLTSDNRTFIYTFGESGTDPGNPVAGYRMNDTDNTMRDWTGNGNNGIIVNSDPAFYAFQNIHDYGSAP